MSYNPEKTGYPAQPQPQPQPAAYANYGQTAGYPSNVVVQQPPAFVAQTGVRPPDFLILSIISIFFCWPMAICAIMYSMNSRSAADANDYSRAMAEGHTARNIGIAAIVLGIVIVTVCVAVPLAMAASVAATICTGWGCDY